MSTNRPTKTNRSIQPIFATVLCAIMVSQSGCSLRCLGQRLMTVINPGRTCDCVDSHLIDGSQESIQVNDQSLSSGSSQSSYSYSDGINVGRQYAIENNLTNTVQSQDDLPVALRDAKLGDRFEDGCMHGINQEVQRNKSEIDSIAPDDTSADSGDGQDELEMLNDLENNDSSNLMAPDQSGRGTSLAEQENPLYPQRSTSLTNQKINDKEADNLLIRNSWRPFKSMSKEQSGNIIGGKGELSRPEAHRPLGANQTLNEYQEQYAHQVFDNERKQTRNRNQFVEPERAQPLQETERKIILSAKPVGFANKPQIMERKEREPQQGLQNRIQARSPLHDQSSTQPERVRQNQVRAIPVSHAQSVIRLTATPAYSIEESDSNRKNSHLFRQDKLPENSKQVLTPEARVTPTRESQKSVLVEHLDGLRIELDPVPTLRANNGTRNHTVPVNNNQANPKLQSPNSTSILRSSPGNQRLQAVNPRLEELLRSPYKRNGETLRQAAESNSGRLSR